ncbi:TetR/AcrR family transcriptional regulator [Simiduia agarivorans]|uniref:TetR family transcriptional regulator n=1 Tax=Simiduia agarivorans (strain DSM 21679 / JCM 13881 / BCRC 17597 / SA1) TaxID=1117647 RepID=K4KH92_SIMAS|nr:TetR family transcriptional regulator [Simiduia agarivorans]AFU97313.1 TetR family transcriptional regulator [Simiduia agarivorans SA1 = DSM 21679]
MTEAKSRRAKGEQTRRLILEAALRLIVEHGHKAVTHRAVAAEADVNLSLTTYYFKDLKSLISEAFDLYRERIERETQETWSEVFTYIAEHPAESGPSAAALRERLANWAADYIMEQVTQRPSGLVLEMTLFYDMHLDPSLRLAAGALRSRFKTDFISLCQRLGSDSPEVDAELFLGTLQRLEYEGLAAGAKPERASIYAQMHRLLQWIMGSSPA